MSAPTVLPCTCDPTDAPRRLPLEEIHPFQRDLKTLHPDQQAQMAASMREFGFSFPEFVWRHPDGHWLCLDGHQRIRVLQAEGMTVEGGVPVVQIEARDEQEAAKKLLLASSTYGKIDPQGLYDFTEAYQIPLSEFDLPDLPDLDLDAYLDGFYENSAVGDGNGAGDEEEGRAPEEEGPTRTSLGELWELGQHRLLVGDSTGDVDDLLDVAPSLQIVDPPFDMDYAAWDLRPGVRVAMVWQRGGNATMWEAAQFGESGAGEWGCHELVFTGGVRGWPQPWFPCTTHDTVRMWRHESARKSFDPEALRVSGCRTVQDGTRPFSVQEHAGGVLTGYGGMSWGKPVLAMLVAMAYVDADDVVWDPCAGSGTSLIAAERTGRVWRGAEIQPRWADLILRRWEEEAGQEAVCTAAVEASP